jgi:hypothetical protein
LRLLGGIFLINFAQVSYKNMQPTPQDLQVKIEQRIRTIRTLWFAMLMSVVMYYVFSLFVGPPENPRPNNALSLMLVGAGLLTTIISFPVKKKILGRSVELQQVGLVQQGLILAMALTEVAALLGLLDFFATGNRYYYVGFLISGIGQLLHFPRREDVLAASFKDPTL